MVLSKTHEPLHLMQQGLQRLGVAASKLEKNNLSDVPAVQDVLALLCVLVSPHNDLDLARALKSPLFAWSDAQFMQLRGAQLAAMPTKKSWFDLLDGDVKTTLLRWQTWLAQMPPHDALQAMYDDGDVLSAYAKALPSAVQASAHAALQALLWAALQVDGGRFLTAYRFVRAMRAKVQIMKAPAVASSADGAVVQLLTVHGAKGLEADTVLLLHSDPEPRKAQSMTTLIGWSPEESAPHAFIFLQSQSSPPASAKALLEEELRAQEIEELNSLYVAMTRARQTLVLSACEAYNSKPTTAWHRLHALCQLAGAPQVSTFNAAAAPTLQLRTLARLSAAVQRLPIDDEDAGAVNLAAQMGKALHRLLQWQSVDDASVATVEREFGLSREQAQATQVRADLMLHGEAAWLWDETKLSWQANEYELFHAGRSLRIDRLVQHRTTHTWWVIDFKSATHPQRTASLREQLANYVQAVSETRGLSPTQIEAAFVTGDGRLVKCGRGVARRRGVINSNNV